MAKKVAKKTNPKAAGPVVNHDSESRATMGKPLLPEQILALTRITSSKLISAARAQVKEGQEYNVDFGVRITGQVIIGHEAEFTANNVPKASDVVQALLAQFGPRKRQQIVSELITVGITRTIAPDDEPVEGLADLAAKLIDGLTTTTKGSRRGNVTGDCEVRLVEWS